MGVPPKYLNIITLLDFQTLQYILLFINDPVLSLMCQCTATEWKCRLTDALWYTASCQLRPGSCCGSYALPSRPCCTATSTIPARRSPTLLKMESSSLYSWSCSTTQTQTLSFRTTTVTAKWTDDVEHLYICMLDLLAGTEELKRKMVSRLYVWLLGSSECSNQDS